MNTGAPSTDTDRQLLRDRVTMAITASREDGGAEQVLSARELGCRPSQLVAAVESCIPAGTVCGGWFEDGMSLNGMADEDDSKWAVLVTR